MAASKQPKSILKKTPYPATTSSREDRNREIALYHANILQQRKDIELEILLSTETLIDYPLATAPYDAGNPSPDDAHAFKNFLKPFQPSDYDAMILERNINEHCGYALCANRRLNEGKGTYRLLGTSGRAKDFRVVKKEELEKWCSDACAKRALYVRVQLSETPAWERGAAEYGVEIDLLDEPPTDENAVLDGMNKLHLGGEKIGTTQDTADLALERGDKGSYATRHRLVNVNIQEKEVRRPAEAPSLEPDDLSERLDTMHLTLEGHTPNFRSLRQHRHRGDEDEGGDWGF